MLERIPEPTYVSPVANLSEEGRVEWAEYEYLNARCNVAYILEHDEEALEILKRHKLQIHVNSLPRKDGKWVHRAYSEYL